MIGQRWTLLVIRDLIRGPKRYTDLREGLPRIPTNLLAARLKELERTGVVVRRVLPRPAGSVVYELTEYGRELEEVIVRLGRWGARWLPVSRPGDVVTEDSALIVLRATFQQEHARALCAGYELHIDEVVVHARITDGTLSAATGRLPEPDLVLDTDVVTLGSLLARDLRPEEAVAAGTVRLIGDPALLTRFLEVFKVPSGRNAAH